MSKNATRKTRNNHKAYIPYESKTTAVRESMLCLMPCLRHPRYTVWLRCELQERCDTNKPLNTSLDARDMYTLLLELLNNFAEMFEH